MEKTQIKTGSKRFSKLTRGIICFLFSAILLANVFPAYAAEVAVDASGWIFDLGLMSIGAENDYAAANGSATAGSDGVISFSATGHTKDGCNDTNKSSTTTITLTNITPAQITVSYTSALTPELTNATVEQVDGVNVATVESQGTLKFSVTSEASGDSTERASVTVKAVAVVASDTLYTTEFKTVPNGGSYTVSHNEETLTVPGSYERTNAIAYVLNATPSDGCTFVGWKNSSGVIFSTSASTTYTSISNNTIQPVFRPTDAATYFINGKPDTVYYFLDEAINAAGNSGMIIVSQSGTAYHSDWSNVGTNVTFEIGKNVKLLVPYSNAYEDHFEASPSAYVSQADGISKYNSGGLAARNFAYCTLTIPIGSKLECNGSINVDGQRQNDGQPFTGVSLGGYGKIILGEEVKTGTFSNPDASDLTAQLIIKSGGFLYCYGYITGTGMVEVQSNGTIHELMQICDWPGGSAAMGSITNIGKNCWYESADQNTLFLLSQFYVQSVEAPLKLCYGANEYVEAILKAGTSNLRQSVPFAGASNGLLQLQTNTSYLLRVYDQFADRMIYHVSGKCVLGGVTIDGIGSIKLSSSNYILPINGSYTFIIESGSELTIGNKMALLPGSEIIVETGSTVNISEQVYIVEYGDFTGTHFFHRATMLQDTDTISNNSPNNAPVPYVATLNRTSPRSENCIEIGYTTSSSGTKTAQYYLDVVNFKVDPVVVNNGTINVTGNGAVYSTASDGTAVVTGTGMIDYKGATTAGSLKAGKSATLNTISSTYGANIAGAGKNKCFTSGVYYGQSNGYWYNWKVTGDADVFTVTAGQTNNQTDALGLVSYYWDGSAAQQSAFSFHVNDDTACPSVSGTATLTYTLDAAALKVDYGLTAVDSDVALSTDTGSSLTTVVTVASNADYAPFSSELMYFPADLDISALWQDEECSKTPATSVDIGKTVYTNGGEAVAAIAKEVKPENDDPKKEGNYVQAFMTVQGAVDAATGENTYVTVLQDRTLTDAIVIREDQNITLDLGGHTLTGKVATVFANATGKKLVTNYGTLRLIKGTITFNGTSTSGVTFDTNPDVELMAATVYNLGTIDYIEEVTLMESSGNLYTAAILNGTGKTINVIRNGTIQGTSQSGGTGIINFGTINTIGIADRTVTITGRRGIEMLPGSKIDLLGGDYSTVTINGGQRGINIVNNTTVTTIGGVGSTINFNTGEYTQHKSCIFVAGKVTTIGGEGSTLNLNLNPKSNIRMCNYGININSGANIETIGAAGSVITITGASAQTEQSGTYRNDMYGIIISGGTVEKIGSTATDKYDASKLYINVSHSGMYGNVGGIYASGGTVRNFGADGTVIFVKSMYTGTGYKGYGIYNNGTITNFGVSGADIEVICNQYGIYNAKTISAMDGVTVISTDTTGSYYGLYNSGTITTISGGYFYHGSGARDRAVRNPDIQKYATGYTLSTDTFPIPASDGTVYNCYYLCAEEVAVSTWAANVVLGNNLDMMFGFVFDAEKTDGYYVKAVRTYADGRVAENIISPSSEWISRDGYYVVTYRGFAAKEMCDSISLMVCDSSGNCISTICTDSIQQYALRMLGKTENGYLRTVIVDMLNYGAACQNALNYPTETPAAEALATYGLTDEQKAWATSNAPTVEDAYATVRSEEGTTWAGSQLETTSNIKYYFAFQNYQEGMYVGYSFTGHKNNPESADKLNFTTVEGKQCIVILDLVVADARCPITVTVYNADGTVYDTWQDSIEAYAARMTETDDVFAAFMKFADSALAYLHNK